MKHKEKRKEKKVKQVDDVTRLFIERERDRQTDSHTRVRVWRETQREKYIKSPQCGARSKKNREILKNELC